MADASMVGLMGGPPGRSGPGPRGLAKAKGLADAEAIKARAAAPADDQEAVAARQLAENRFEFVSQVQKVPVDDK
ncbi:hypothetical protein [Streptomyces sp. SID5643]|uniref:hypothetical protein n=1 Tax=Streptomyces sp. SID5643 TaxID=2690307 RepID=UPI0013F7068E|nr:hypothetical protein [Streptomyces sp. SID5643]MZF87584.1 hypothetical protein [Streptomyces sp. SID5643]